jgi:hypothetical protein
VHVAGRDNDYGRDASTHIQQRVGRINYIRLIKPFIAINLSNSKQ